MKTILVATDFSKASYNASLYGIELAKAFNANLVLFSAYQPIPVPVTEAPMVINLQDLKNLTQEQLDDCSSMINVGNKVHLETLCKEGTTVKSILEIAKIKKADVIIAGMKSSGRGIRRIFGSAVTELSKKTTVPMIVVPEEAKYSDLEVIALANDSDIEPESDKHILDALRSIATRFHSRLYMVRIAKNEFQEAFEVLNRPFRLNNIIRTLDPQYEYLWGKDIPKALNAFIDKHKVNMLALLPHKHSLLEKFFFESTTHSMVFETKIPLLILPGSGISGS